LYLSDLPLLASCLADEEEDKNERASPTLSDQESSRMKYGLLLKQVVGNYMETRLLSSTLRQTYIQQLAARKKYSKTERYQQAQDKYKRDIAQYQKTSGPEIRTASSEL
jgi:hypothetical protein